MRAGPDWKLKKNTSELYLSNTSSRGQKLIAHNKIHAAKIYTQIPYPVSAVGVRITHDIIKCT